MLRSHSRLGLLWLGILGGAIPALAQSESTPAAASAADIQAPVVSATLLVTASLAAESDERLPVTADVIDREEIEARQATSIADLLRTVPGIDVVRAGGPGKQTSLFTRGTESDHTLVLWNGIELNNPYFGGYDWGLLPTEGVERVEVVRGPASALYGSDAVGGVVQILTGGSTRTASLEMGDAGYRRATLAATFDSERARLAVSAHSRTGDGSAVNDFYDSDEMMARASFDVTGNLELGLTVRGNDSDLGIPFSGGQPSPNRTTNWREREVALPLRFERGPWSVEGQLSRVEHENRFQDPDDPFGFTAAEDRSTSERARVVATRTLGEGLWFAFGSDYERQEVDSGSVFGVDLGGERQTTRAQFGQVFYASERWSFDFGIRADDHDVFGRATTPRLGLSLRLSARHRLRAAAARGFRAPSIGELFFPFSGNLELEPEESESVEVGYGFQGQRWGTTVTAFRIDLEQLIDFDFVRFINVNVGRARTSGLELSANRRWRTAELRANASWLDTENLDTGLRLLRRPEWRASLVATWRPGDWVLSATGVASGDRDDVDPISFARAGNPGYHQLDLAARYRGWSRWSPYARVENLTDEQYAEALGFPAPGTTMVAGLSLDF